MINYQICNEEWEDGCLQRILQIINEQSREIEYYTFHYDKDINSLDLVRRMAPDWKAPFHTDRISNYVAQQFYEINNIISQYTLRYDV